jgi:hypothetical protein
MFAKTQKSVSMILGVALSAAATFAAPAFAGEASISQNERAAQSAIVATETPPTSVDTSPATLAGNEALAQRAIVDLQTPASPRVDAIDNATLAQNEISAQRAIADAAASAATYTGAAKSGVASTHAAAQH